MKKFAAIFMCAALAVGALSGCSSNENSSTADNSTAGNPISVVTREDGSGTRGAFVELFGIEDADGNDAITQSAEISNSTSVVMTTVAGNPDAIGYASLASIKDTVKALNVDGVTPGEATVKDGNYKVQRPFVLVTMEGKELSPAAQAFFDYAVSSDAASIIAKAGAVAVAG